MNKLVSIIIVFLTLQSFAQNNKLKVYLYNTDEPSTNITNAPAGNIIKTLSSSDEYSFDIIEVSNGWMKIDISTLTHHTSNEDIAYLEDLTNGGIMLRGAKPEYWIHNSAIACNTRGDGDVVFTLRQQPNAFSETIYKSSEFTIFRIIDLRGDWVKVKTLSGNHIGWILSNELCGNPVSICN